MHPHTSWTCLLPLFFVSSFALTGCGNAAVSKGADPLHVHLFCLASDDGEGLTCEPQERLAHFNSWVKEAVYRPYSTFSIWQAGPDRSRSRRFFGACIPERWPAPVWKAKGDFIAVARAGAGGRRTGLSVPAGCRSSGPTTPGSMKLVVSPEVSPLQADVWGKVASGFAPALVQHSGIVCDRSDSTLGAACNASALLGVFDRWVTEGLLLPGATLSVEMVGPLRDALRPFYELRVPDLPLGERIAFVLGARSELAHLFSGSVEKYGSTIAEAISTAVRRLREHRGAYRLYLLSDMRQISPGGFNFESAVPLPQDFLAWLTKSGLTPDLRDIPALVCGLHTGHFGQNSQASATRLHDLWQRALQSMGAPEIKFFNSCEAAFAAS
jgi:hypothetical protein